jgi:hypothetical protein
LSKFFETDSPYTQHLSNKIKQFMDQAIRYNAMAQQDTNPTLQLVHCVYALAHALVVRNLASERDIARITGSDIHDLIEHLQTCEAVAIKNVGQQCPNIKVDGVFALNTV